MRQHNHPVPDLALIGVTGYGSIYWQNVRELLAANLVRLKAAVVINPHEAEEAVAEMREHGTRIYSSYDEMLSAEAGQVDLCLIPTGISWHTRMTVAALEAGMNVLVEKPLAGSLADARIIRKAEGRTDRWVAVGFQDMYCPEAQWLKRVLCDGEIGEIQRVRMFGLWPRPVSYFTRNHWAGKLEADGVLVLDSPLNNAFAHFVNLCFYLTGPDIETSADVRPTEVKLWRAHSIETFDTGWVRAESDSGIDFEFFVSHACPAQREPEIRIEGSSGHAEWHHEGPVVLYPDGRDATVRPLPGNCVTRRAMFEAALQRLSDPKHFVCTSAVAEKHTAFIDALHRFNTIEDVHPGEIEWKVRDGSDPIPTVRGIDSAFSGSAAASSGNSREDDDDKESLLGRKGFFEAFQEFSPAVVEQSSTAAFPVTFQS